MQKWKCSRESVTFIDKDMYEDMTRMCHSA